MLVLVTDGKKRIVSGHAVYNLEPGDAIAIAEGQSIDVVNAPCSVSGLYRAELLLFDPDLIALFARDNPAGVPIRSLYPLPKLNDDFYASFRHLRNGISREQHVPQKAVISRAIEVLAWLDHHGGHFVPPTTHRSTMRRVRLKIADDVAADWTGPVVATQLGMSEATMRRRLAEEGTSFSAILVEARMSRALALLQMTDLSVREIAYETGYDSPSSFAARFRERYGFSPSTIRTSAKPRSALTN
ncbi:helix-turn-helix transcriptional regulator [Cupriavidus sp. PET2-C1]